MSNSDVTNILIVDDLPEKHAVYRVMLEELGQNLVSAKSGSDALREVLKRDFAVILLDVNMPEMSGFETAHLIRQRRRSAHTPIIFLTAFSDDVQSSQGYATGGVDYITTPVVPEILRAKVRVFVELHRMRQQVAHQAVEQARRAAAEEAARRSAFLAEASRSLMKSLDLEATVHALLRLAVPMIGDLACVTVAEAPAGCAGSSVAAWRQLGTEELAVTGWNERQWASDRIRRHLAHVQASRESQWLDDLDEPHPFQPEEDIGNVNSLLLLPIHSRDRLIGIFQIARCTFDERFNASDHDLAANLAERAGIALDNARLYHDIRENDRRKNEFLAMLSHELRNPLAPVRNAVHVIRQSGIDHPRLNWARDVIDRQVTHLVRLVDDLLDVSRITGAKIRLQLEEVDLNKVVNAAVETSRPIIESHSHRLNIEMPREPICLEGDFARLVQVVSNLLNNAAKYTPDGGRIDLVLERNPTDAVIRVRDSGEGIPPHMLKKVFELFTQVDQSVDRAQGGLGVGLTLVQRLVDLHNGRVEAFSEGKDRGTEFTIHLPVRSPGDNCGESPTPALAPEAANKRRQVLVVDDNRDSADTLAMLLESVGHEVRVAYDGPEALETTGLYAPDVVLLDIGLPGLDGYEVARRLRAEPKTAEPLLLAVSGYGQEEDRERCREAGFDGHLTKPVDFEKLQSMIAEFVPRT